MPPAARSSRSSVASRAARRAKPRTPRPRRVGCETPRIFTPPLRPLTEQTSLGFLAIEFAEEVCKLTLFPWQKWLLIHMLELAPGLTVDTMRDRGPLDPLLRFRKVVILVARQNGKTTLSKVLALFFMYVLGTRVVLGTAQDLDTAEETWQSTVDLVEEVDDDDEPVRPDLFAEKGRVVQVNGKKALVLRTGERYKVKAANRKAGRGLSGDLCMLDELREHQTWEAWAAITKTTNARPAALIAAMSNAGDASSVVLRHLRLRAHAALDDPDGINADETADELLPDDLEGDDLDVDELLDDLEDEDDWDSLGLFEWSAPPGVSVFDRDGWAQANPSLGYCISERTLAGDAKDDPEWTFRTEVLCQWPEGSLSGLFPTGAWQAGVDAESRRADGAEVVACVDVDHDRSRAYVTIAGRRDDGRVHVECVATRAGVEWVLPWFLDDAYPHRAAWRVTGQTRGAPVSSVMEDLKGAGIEVVDWGGSDLQTSYGRFYDLVRIEDEDGGKKEPGVFHRPQSVLDVAVANAAAKPLGDGWVADRAKSPVGIGGFVSAVGAVWLLEQEPPAPVPEPRIRILGRSRS